MFSKLVQYISPKGNEVDVISRQIANAHTTFNVTCTLIWLPLIPVMVKIVSAIVRGKEDEEVSAFAPQYLDDKLIMQPAAAMYLVSEEIKRSASYAKKTLQLLNELFSGKKSKGGRRQICGMFRQCQGTAGVHFKLYFEDVFKR